MVATIPESVHDYWAWIHAAVSRAPAILPDGQGPCGWFGPYNWTIQTFLYLRGAGLAPRLTATLPEEGIIIAHSDFLAIQLKPSARQFVVEMKPDRALRCAYANFAIVQNPRDPIRSGIRRALTSSAAVSYWPQPGLISRRADRGGRFENICFMGNADQFIPGAETLEAELARRGLRWTMIPRDRWHDYSEADAIVAVRTATPKGRDANAFSPARKPASKLCNAWLAGVPAILSPDVAFRDLRRSPLDYLEAQTIPEVLEAIDRLRDDIDLRRAMAENAAARA